jgi:hypothetical protein
MPLAGGRGFPHYGRVLVFLLLGWMPIPLVLALLLALYLTAVELRELRPHWLWWIWWLLLVFLTNFVGYLVLRAYALYHRWQLNRSRA